MRPAERPGPDPLRLPVAAGNGVPDPLPFHLLDRPLEYLLADHFRHRTLLAVLRRFAAERQASREEADRVTAYLLHDLPLHHADEEEDFFPAIRRRAVPEDELGALLARLNEDHRRAEALLEEIAARLSREPGANRVRFDRPDAERFQAYAASEHRHLAIENGLVLAIASVRLTRTDLRAISKGMKARRGVEG